MWFPLSYSIPNAANIGGWVDELASWMNEQQQKGTAKVEKVL